VIEFRGYDTRNLRRRACSIDWYHSLGRQDPYSDTRVVSRRFWDTLDDDQPLQIRLNHSGSLSDSHGTSLDASDGTRTLGPRPKRPVTFWRCDSCLAALVTRLHRINTYLYS
jgi:hypothetical protein